MSDKKIVTVNSRKFDGKIHRSWRAELKTRRNSLLILTGKFEQEINHPHLGIIRRGTISEEFFWLDRWYSIFRFSEPDGTFRNFYCNLNMPPKFENNVLDYIDLDVDILVWKDMSYETLDLAEFEENAVTFGYSKKLKLKVSKSVDEVLKLVELRRFPFDF